MLNLLGRRCLFEKLLLGKKFGGGGGGFKDVPRLLAYDEVDGEEVNPARLTCLRQ